MILKYEVVDNKYFNIKEVLKSYFKISDRLLVKLKNNKRIFLNDKLTYVTSVLSIGDIVTANIDFDEECNNIIPTQMDLEILYEDEYILAINKSANLPVHPSAYHNTDTLSNGIRYYFNLSNLKRKIRIVNRLDKDTTGIVIIAKNEYIQECLIKQMKTNDFVKEYIAILTGHLKKETGTITAPISRKSDSIIEREVSEFGEVSITHFKVIKYLNNLTLVNFRLETGRTHQIRVHSKYIGHAIIGDTLYSNPSSLISRQALHAYRVEFIHPITKDIISIKSDFPDDINCIINKQK